MNKQEFITRLMTKYSHHFNDENAKIWRDDYLKVLEGDIDFDYLYKIFNKEYESVKLPPSAAYIQSLTKRSFNVSKTIDSENYSNMYKPIEKVPFDESCSDFAALYKELYKKKSCGQLTTEQYKQEFKRLREEKLQIKTEAS